MKTNRFQDENKRITEFFDEVWVVCPSCSHKAVATIDQDEQQARLLCQNCGYNKTQATTTTILGITGKWKIAANRYFDANLWLVHPFKNDVFIAYNLKHLNYLEAYISAKLREHKDRTHFTVLEKLPKFYHEAKNREALLKIIEKLKNKK